MNTDTFVHFGGRPITQHLEENIGFSITPYTDKRKSMNSNSSKGQRSKADAVSGNAIVAQSEKAAFDAAIFDNFDGETVNNNITTDKDLKIIQTEKDSRKIVQTDIVLSATFTQSGMTAKENVAQEQRYEYAFEGDGYGVVYGNYVHTEILEVEDFTAGVATLQYPVKDTKSALLVRVGDSNLTKDFYSLAKGSTASDPGKLTISNLISLTGKQIRVVYITTLTELPVV